MHIQHCTTPGKQSCAELDTQDDTLCGVTTFWLHNLTGKDCDMSPFSSSYELMQDVKISTFLTAYTDEYGKIGFLSSMKFSGLGRVYITRSLIQIRYGWRE